MPISVKVSKRLLAKFGKEARKFFPLEYYAMFAGKVLKNGTIHIRDIIWPLEGELYSTKAWVSPSLEYFVRAAIIAKKDGRDIVADMHSHCSGKGGYSSKDPSPSYGDFKRCGQAPYDILPAFGICHLFKNDAGKIQTKYNFWNAESIGQVKLEE